MNLHERFAAKCGRRFPFLHNHRTLLAVSGGADSMVMCHLFQEAGLEFGVAHCNFRLRGEASDLDEALVKAWATSHHIPFFNTGFDTARIATERKKGIQETARDLRYAWLEDIRQQHNFQWIATAHHANDNVETLLMNLFKGTGMSGLHAIPEQNGKVIRPLLFAPRSELREYAVTHSVPFREDASNISDKYLRNAVRLNILPVIEQYFPNVIGQVQESIERFAEGEKLYRKEIDRQIEKLVQLRGNDRYISVKALRQLETARAICFEVFREYGFTPGQITNILELADASSGKFIESDTHRVIRDRDFLILTAKHTSQTDFISIPDAPCKVSTADGDFYFVLAEHEGEISTDTYTAFIDAQAIRLPLILRRWRTGDYFYPLGMGMKKKKVSRYLIDQKVPLHQKEKIWVLECDKKIVWLAGMRLDERFKIRSSTRQILKVELRVE
jgi:tRNA(Ile)-lysidine synthase